MAKSKVKKSKEKNKLNAENLLVFNIIIFSVVAFLHFFRIVLMAPIFVGSFELPMWISGMALAALVVLIWQNWIQTEKSKKTCVKILIGIIAIDFFGVLGAWYYNIDFFGLTGNTYAVIALIDAFIVAGLLLYLKKK